METTFSTINPNQIEFEGFCYLEFNGEFFKGCRRCGGAGHYSHNGEHSRCYECDNTSAKLGDHFTTEAEAQKWCHGKALRAAAAQRKRDREALALRLALEAKVAAMPDDVRSFLLAVVIDGAEYDEFGNMTNYNYETQEKSSFVVAMAEHAQYPALANKPFTEKMIAAVRNTIASRSEKAAEISALPPIVEGRQLVRGVVLSTKSVDSMYGTAYKMLVQDARGFKLFGSIPSNLWDEVEFLGSYRKNSWSEVDGVMTKLKGMEISFTATVEASGDDKSFGFFKRPTKAEVVA